MHDVMRPGLHAPQQRVKVWVQCLILELGDKFLKGANPARLTVERATALKLITNFKTVKALVLTLPPFCGARTRRSSSQRISAPGGSGLLLASASGTPAASGGGAPRSGECRGPSRCRSAPARRGRPSCPRHSGCRGTG